MNGICARRLVGLDYFGARYYSGATGRFTSPDAPLLDQHPEDPQSWNLYSYVRNNPLRFTDPTGQCSQAPNGNYTDEGDGLFAGPCSSGTIGDSNNNSNSVSVGVGRQEAALIMLSGVGEALSSPSQLASVARGGLEGAMTVEGLRGIPALWSGFRSLLSGSGLTTLGLDATRLQAVPGAAQSAANGARLAKSLASEQQVGEVLSGQTVPVAGAGTAKSLRDAQRLAATYGGRAEEWVKVASSNYKPAGGGASFEVHAYRNVRTGQIVELKTKFQ